MWETTQFQWLLCERVYTTHYTDWKNGTGCTVFVFAKPLTAAVFLCGSAPASREFAALSPGSAHEVIHGLVLSGGSAFGLDSTSGMMIYQKHKGRGVQTSAGVVPICPTACIFDLNYCEPVWPTPDNVLKACEEAENLKLSTLPMGQVGAGTGATVGKCLSDKELCSNGGFAFATWIDNSISISVFVIVNCWGDVIDEVGKVIAGVHSTTASEFLNTIASPNDVAEKKSTRCFDNQNTTLAVVFTNLRFTRNQLLTIGKMASAGIARATQPAFTPFDGDMIYCISTSSNPTDVFPSSLLCLRAGALAAEGLAVAIRQACQCSK